MKDGIFSKTGLAVFALIFSLFLVVAAPRQSQTKFQCNIQFKYADDRPYIIHYAKLADYHNGDWTLSSVSPKFLLLEKAGYYFKFQSGDEISEPKQIDCISDLVIIDVK